MSSVVNPPHPRSELDARCTDVVRLLGAHADGQLDPAKTLEVDDHLGSCESCRERVQLDRAIRGSLKKAVRTTAPSNMRARMLAAMTAAPAGTGARAALDSTPPPAPEAEPPQPKPAKVSMLSLIHI